MGVARWPPCGLDQKLIVLGIGFTALPAQALLIYACQNEKAGIVSIARSTMPVFALIFQITFFGIYPDRYSIIGNLIILAAIFGLAFKMLRQNKSETMSKDDVEIETKAGAHQKNFPTSVVQRIMERQKHGQLFSPSSTITSTMSTSVAMSAPQLQALTGTNDSTLSR